MVLHFQPYIWSTPDQHKDRCRYDQVYKHKYCMDIICLMLQRDVRMRRFWPVPVESFVVMSVEEVHLLPGCAHVRVNLEVLEQRACPAFLDADDDCSRQMLGGRRNTTVPRVSDRPRSFGCRWRRRPLGGVPTDRRRADQRPQLWKSLRRWRRRRLQRYHSNYWKINRQLE